MTGDDHDDGKVVSLEPRLKMRQPNHDEPGRRMYLRMELAEVSKAAVEKMRKLGATSDEIAAQLLSAVDELQRKR